MGYPYPNFRLCASLGPYILKHLHSETYGSGSLELPICKALGQGGDDLRALGFRAFRASGVATVAGLNWG